jgi:hypothetical protein
VRRFLRLRPQRPAFSPEILQKVRILYRPFSFSWPGSAPRVNRFLTDSVHDSDGRGADFAGQIRPDIHRDRGTEDRPTPGGSHGS